MGRCPQFVRNSRCYTTNSSTASHLPCETIFFDEGKKKTLVDLLLVGGDDNGNGVVPIIATVNDNSDSAENHNILAL